MAVQTGFLGEPLGHRSCPSLQDADHEGAFLLTVVHSDARSIRILEGIHISPVCTHKLHCSLRQPFREGDMWCRRLLRLSLE